MSKIRTIGSDQLLACCRDYLWSLHATTLEPLGLVGVDGPELEISPDFKANVPRIVVMHGSYTANGINVQGALEGVHQIDLHLLRILGANDWTGEGPYFPPERPEVNLRLHAQMVADLYAQCDGRAGNFPGWTPTAGIVPGVYWPSVSYLDAQDMGDLGFLEHAIISVTLQIESFPV